MKPNILLIGDDIRYPTGVANICKDIIVNTLGDFNWTQLASKNNHPNNGKVIDVSKSLDELYDTTGSNVRLFCNSGYGNESLLDGICASEKIDAVLHMSDPRFYKWLYATEGKLRKTTPLCYYHVWDNYPTPHFNRGIYHSCDWIGCISKLTHSIVQDVTDSNVPCDYVPHGVDLNTFKKQEEMFSEGSRHNLLKDGCDFCFLCNNVNMKRKQLPVIIEAFDKLMKTLPVDESKHILLMMHTNQVGQNKHDIIKLCDNLFPDTNILFSTTKVSPEILSQMYNTSNVTVNASCNEGFGLSTLESLACETPIICNKTGGLSDQIDDHNTWGIGLEPDHRHLTGDGDTNYLYEDYLSPDTLATAMMQMYKNKDNLNDMGKLGRAYVEENFSVTKMVDGIRNGILSSIENFTPSPKYRFSKL
jgi:glycosyltransferase involved in cell wall biosynthesis